MRPHPLLALGLAVRDLRESRGLSQERCGELAALHRNQIGAIERGEKNVSFLNLLRICRALEVSPSDLLRGFTVNAIKALPPKRTHRNREK